jgi:voltage-gated potassium channel
VTVEKMAHDNSIAARLNTFLNKLEFFFMALGFAYLGIYSVQVLVNPPNDVQQSLEIAGWAIYGVFIVDLLLRIVVWFPRFSKFSGWVGFIKTNWLALLAAALPAFRAFRVLRVLIVLRGLQPYMQSRVAKVMMVVGVALPLILYTASLAILEVERDAIGSHIVSFGDALWWAMVTVTTVGYGDSFPITAEGRTIGTFLIFTGIGLFSTLTALIASWVMQDKQQAQKD